MLGMLDSTVDHAAGKSHISARDIGAAWLAVLLAGSTLMMLFR